MRPLLYNFFLPLLFTVVSISASAQTCDDVPVTYSLEGNAVSATYSTGGDLYFDGQEGGYIVSPPGGEEPFVAILAASLWMGAKDPGGNIRIAAPAYGRNQNNFDYQPGPLTDEGTTMSEACGDWNRPFQITRSVVEDYLEAFDGVPLQPNMIDSMILGWPASGNPFFADLQGFELPNTAQGLAPYFDNDLDGRYDPTMGDYPLFCGDRAVWSVFNDARLSSDSNTPTPLSAEIRLLAYSFDSDDEVLNTTTFHEYTIVNRDQEDYQDFYAAQWVDFDLGCFTNDAFHSVPQQDLFYFYNTESEAGLTCAGGVTSTGGTMPVVIVQMVEGLQSANEDFTDVVEIGMSSLTTAYNAFIGSPDPRTTDPQTPEEYFNYLSGTWRDGTPITRGGIGIGVGTDTTRFVYDGGETPEGGDWRSCNPNVDRVFSDGRALMTSGPVTLQPGAVNTMTIAVTTIFDVAYRNDCPNEDFISLAANDIQSIFDESCSRERVTTGLRPTRSVDVGVKVYPNPTDGIVRFELTAGPALNSIELFDLTGRRVFERRGAQISGEINLAESGIRRGLYLYRVQGANGSLAGGRVVVR